MYISWSEQQRKQTQRYLERALKPANALGYQGRIGHFARYDQERKSTDFGVVCLSGVAHGPVTIEFTRDFRKAMRVQYPDFETMLSDGWVVG